MTLARLASLCLLAAIPAFAADTEPAPALPSAGKETALTAAANPAVHYKLYLPTAYDKNPAATFPVLINHNPGGKTRISPYIKWAEDHGVILVGVDGISNGMDQGKKNIMDDGAFKDLGARGARLHPTLRMTIGMSGGSADGMRLVRRKPGLYAGCVYMGAGSIIDKAPHLAYAILGGAKDEWMPGDACYAMAEKAKALGCSVRMELEIDRQHREAPLDRQYAALTWMLELQKLQLPSLPEAERAANLAAARQRMKAVAGMADPAARRAEAELLLELPPLKACDERAGVLAAWAGAVTELSKGQKDPVSANALLAEALRWAGAQELPESATKPVLTLAETLRKAPAVAADARLRERYQAAETAEERAGLKPEKLQEVLPLWEALAKETGGTDWDAKVKRRVEVVKFFIENPSTIQKPTKLPR